MATERPRIPSRPHAYRGFESEPSDEWREDYGRGGPVRSDEPERDWFFEHSAAPPPAAESAVSSRRDTAPRAAATGRRSSERVALRKPISYRGRGPKGYRPSDERIQEIVCERLTEHPRVDASDLAVAVDQGVVTISGNLSDLEMKPALDEMLSSIHGVVRVQNDVRILPKLRPR